MCILRCTNCVVLQCVGWVGLETTNVVCAHSVAATYAGPMPAAPATTTAPDDDPLGLEAAFENALAPAEDALGAPDYDPLDIDTAFDEVFACGGGGKAADASDISTAPSVAPSLPEPDDIGSEGTSHDEPDVGRDY